MWDATTNLRRLKFNRYKYRHTHTNKQSIYKVWCVQYTQLILRVIKFSKTIFCSKLDGGFFEKITLFNF